MVRVGPEKAEVRRIKNIKPGEMFVLANNATRSFTCHPGNHRIFGVLKMESVTMDKSVNRYFYEFRILSTDEVYGLYCQDEDLGVIVPAQTDTCWIPFHELCANCGKRFGAHFPAHGGPYVYSTCEPAGFGDKERSELPKFLPQLTEVSGDTDDFWEELGL